ncbi:prostaglandin E synthase 3 homolog [Eurosta solidaginis]|uniref:prostaglandin E synthase 3 homolog n=1 Tax=Eurosta solidaginis TaxID=178769 RepID=UPI00353085F8
MTESAGTIYPPVSWAQRFDLLYIIIDVECTNIEHKVTENSFTFKGVNALDASKKYEVTLNFLHPVDPEKVTSKNIGRCMEFTIYKKEKGPYWPSLTNDKIKLHFLKANFAKWKNESDDEDEGPADAPFNDMFNSSWNKKFDDMGLEDDDSDDDIPSLSKNDEDSSDEEKQNAEGGGKAAAAEAEQK